MIFGILFNLIIVFIVGFGLFVLVSKEFMEQEKTMSAEERGSERVNPAFHLFLYLTSFVSMGFMIGGMLTTVFQLVNKYIPDTQYTANVYDISIFDDSAIKVGISMLFIAGLVYFIVARLVNKKLQDGDVRPDSIVRKFITYIALFVLVATSIGSLANLIYQYLSGGLTGNYFAKIVAFFAVTAYFAYFYFWEVRRKDFMSKNFDYFYYGALSVVVVVFLSGIFVADSPQVTREKKIDDSLVMEIQNINSNIQIFFTNNKRLPGQNEIEKSEKFPTIEYKTTSDKVYELCGTFLQSRERIDLYDKQWNHPAGKHCFKLNIDERQVKGEIPMQVVQ